MRVELAWVDVDGQVRSCWLELPEQATLGDALASIETAHLREGLVAGRLAAAVFGELRAPGERLWPNDRIELVEGLRVDPKLARQRRAALRRARLERERG